MRPSGRRGCDAVSRRRKIWWAAAISGLLLLAAPILAWRLRAPLVRSLVGESCTPVVAPKLDMVELIAIRRKTRVHARHRDQPLELSGREMSWVLTEQYRIPVEISATGDRVALRKPISLQGGGCGDFEIVGRVQVVEGRLRVLPDELKFGGWPIPVPERWFLVSRDWMGPEAPEVERLIGGVDSLEVRDGTFRVVIGDVGILP